MWVEEADERPSFAEIVQTLQNDVRGLTHEDTDAESNMDKNDYVDLSTQ